MTVLESAALQDTTLPADADCARNFDCRADATLHRPKEEEEAAAASPSLAHGVETPASSANTARSKKVSAHKLCTCCKSNVLYWIFTISCEVVTLAAAKQNNSKAIFDEFFTADGQSKVPRAASLSNAANNPAGGKTSAAASPSAKKYDALHTHSHTRHTYSPRVCGVVKS